MRTFVMTMPLGAVSVLHVIHGLMSLTGTVGTTSIIGLAYNHPGDWVPLALGPTALGITYLIASILSLGALIFPRWPLHFHVLCWLPQQLLIVAAGLSSVEAMALGHYLDGTGGPASGIVITLPHIIADQVAYPILAIVHFIGFWLWRYVEEADAQLLRRVGGH